MLRMGFGVGRLRRTKHIFVHAVGIENTALKRGQVTAELERMMHWTAEAVNCCGSPIEATDGDCLSEEKVAEHVRKASVVDDDDIGPDRGARSFFSIEAMRAAAEEENEIRSPGE